MDEKLHILLLEDSADDVELINIELSKADFLFILKVVETEDEFLNALKSFAPDLILADYTLPSYDGLSALFSTREKHPDVPFIFASGTIGEEKAIEAMRSGATDYVLKGRLSKLIPAIYRAIQERNERQKRLIAEEGLLNSAREWKATFDAMDEAICLIGAEGKIIRCNKAMANYLDKPFTEIIGGTCWELMHGTKEPIAGCPVSRMRETRKRETMLMTVDDKTLNVSADPILDKNGNISQAVHIISDLTEMERSKQELRDSEEIFRKMFQSSVDGMVLGDKNGGFVKVNKAMSTILGYSEKEYLSMTTADLTYPGDIDIDSDIARQLWSGEIDNFAVEKRYVHKNGNIVWSETTVFAIRDKEGDLQYTVGRLRNITEQKTAYEALKVSNKKLQESEGFKNAIINGSPDCIKLLDLDGNLKFMSRGGQEQLEIKDINVYLDTNWIDFWKNQDYKNARKAVHTARKGGIGRFKGYSPTEAGNPRWWDVIVSPLLGSNRTVEQLLAFSRDITEQKKMEESLIHSQKLESIGNLAGGIAHDFNNILSSIIGFTELALDDVERESNIEDNLQEVYLAGKRAKDLVKQILTFARQSDEKLKPIQVDIILKEVLGFLRSSIPASIEIKQSIASDSLIMGNGTQVHQILMNLCTNAAYVMEEEGGILSVNLKDVVAESSPNWIKMGLAKGEYIEIKVSDTGSGIAPEILNSIFEPYFTTKSPGEGTGMGLAVVHGIVESYYGKIFVDSTIGEGSVFTIYLPITKKRNAQHPYESPDLPTGVERILFVDDEAPIAKMGSQGLERLGYKVTTRTSSVEALELFRSKPNDFDLVITDMTMPNMTGDRLAIEIMKIKLDIPVILCTGYSKKISDASASEMNIKAFLYKPIINADLAKTVRKVLDEAKSGAHA